MNAISKKSKIIFCLFVLLFLFSNHRSFAGSDRGPKVLMFTEIDVNYLNDTIKTWGEKAGINGFMLTHIADWWTPRNQLFENMEILKEMNQKGALYGVDRNFIKVALGYKKLPDWTDDKAWAVVIDNFKNIAELARQTGTRGVALDAEPYEVPFYNSTEAPAKNTLTDFLKTKIRQRGMQIMEALESVFPEIEIVTFPEGALYWFNPEQGPNPKEAELWIDFFNGLAAGRKKGRIILAAESTYSKTGKDEITKTYNLIDKTMRDHVEDPKFWREKCSLAVGMWPLGKTYTDKSARYSVENFREQFSQSTALSPEYVWIYDHGSAWFQLTNEEIQKYTANNHSIWDKETQILPTDPLIREYYRVVKTRGALK